MIIETESFLHGVQQLWKTPRGFLGKDRDGVVLRTMVEVIVLIVIFSHAWAAFRLRGWAFIMDIKVISFAFYGLHRCMGCLLTGGAPKSLPFNGSENVEIRGGLDKSLSTLEFLFRDWGSLLLCLFFSRHFFVHDQVFLPIEETGLFVEWHRIEWTALIDIDRCVTPRSFCSSGNCFYERTRIPKTPFTSHST